MYLHWISIWIDPISKKIFISRDVLFSEDEFPFQQSAPLSVLDQATTSSSPGFLVEEDTDITRNEVSDSGVSAEDEIVVTPTVAEPDDADLPTVVQQADPEPEEPLGRTFRQRFPNVRLADYIVTNHVVTKMTPPSDSSLEYPISDFVNCVEENMLLILLRNVDFLQLNQ